jgi:serine/threonine-protein kinase
MFSPDGRWLVYAVKEAGRDEEVYVQAYPGPGTRWLISSGGGTEPVWSPTGQEIFYRTPDGTRMMSVTVQTRPTLQAAAPRQLFQGGYAVAPGNFWANYDVGPDGQQFLMLEPEQVGSDTQVAVILNWFEELKRRVPVR